MSADHPARPRRRRMRPKTKRTVVVGVAAAVAVAVMIFGALQLVGPEAVRTDGAFGGGDFRVGHAGRLAERVRTDRAPFLIQDPLGGTRDIYVQHMGGAEDENWLVFEARAPDQPERGCNLRWDGNEEHFVDPCTGERFPADGAGLVHYPTRVEDGVVRADLRRPEVTEGSPAT